METTALSTVSVVVIVSVRKCDAVWRLAAARCGSGHAGWRFRRHKRVGSVRLLILSVIVGPGNSRARIFTRVMSTGFYLRRHDLIVLDV